MRVKAQFNIIYISSQSNKSKLRIITALSAQIIIFFLEEALSNIYSLTLASFYDCGTLNFKHSLK